MHGQQNVIIVSFPRKRQPNEVVLCKSTLLRMRLTVGVHTHIHSQAHSQQRTLTQHDMLPQLPINIKELISECFYNVTLARSNVAP